ncbi:MAG: hypothetical protein K2X74_11480 [Acetobacteraceae bacterium]|nr:hypothetical protein [Acetobacteraceae bacterium]
MPPEPQFEEAPREIWAWTGCGAPPPPTVASPRDDGDDPNMEARVKRLEDDVHAIRDDLTTMLGRMGALEGRLGSIERKLDLLVTQIVAKIPSGLQLFGLLIGTLVAIVSILGVAFALAQWLKLIPR